MKAGRLVTVSLFLMPGAILGQTEPTVRAQGDSNMSCIDRLEIPGYPALATQARIQGTITVSVVLTTGGSVEKVDTEAASKYPQAKSLFGTPVWKAIQQAKFRPDCSGKTVRLIFHFDLAGTSPLQQKGSVFFGHPNTFWIVAEAPLLQPEAHVDTDALRKDTRIFGRVVDPLGDPVRTQPVRLNAIQSPDAPAITRTDADGFFGLDATHGGSYELVFEVPGFSRLAVPVNVRGVSLNIGTVTLNVAPIEGPIEVPTYTAPVSQSLNPKGQRPDAIRGRYENIDYGFRVDIPGGLLGEGSTPPAPNHGFVIKFDSKSVLLVDASYEMPDSPYVFRSFNARLDKLRAERKSWSDSEGGAKLLHESIVARGFDRRTPIIYTIQLDTTAEHLRDGLRLLEALKTSFRTIPVRP